MSQSTDGQLCYGIAFPESFAFPWEDYDEDDWWLEVSGFKPSKEIYTKDGSKRLPGITQKDIDAHFIEKYKWGTAHPMPIKVVNYCSGECPMYLVCVPESFFNNSRGYAQVIDPEKLKVTDEQKQTLLDFVEKYLKDSIDEHNSEEFNEQIDVEPKWLLTSCWD